MTVGILVYISRNMCKKLTTEEFIEKVCDLHGKDTFDLSESVYINSRSVVTVFCIKHGEFVTSKAGSLLRDRKSVV